MCNGVLSSSVARGHCFRDDSERLDCVFPGGCRHAEDPSLRSGSSSGSINNVTTGCHEHGPANERGQRNRNIDVSRASGFRKNHRRGRHHQARKEKAKEKGERSHGLRHKGRHGRKRKQVAPLRFVRILSRRSNHGGTRKGRGLPGDPKTHRKGGTGRDFQGGTDPAAPCPGQAQRPALCQVPDGTNEQQGRRNHDRNRSDNHRRGRGATGGPEAKTRQAVHTKAKGPDGPPDQHRLVLQPGLRALPRRVLSPPDRRNDDGRNGRPVPRAAEKHPQHRHPRHHGGGSGTERPLPVPCEHGAGDPWEGPDHHRSVQPDGPSGTGTGRPGRFPKGTRRSRGCQPPVLLGGERRHPEGRRRL
mmetsp:Transcript_92495/g.188228  ORF Transcript_92495/g.188228 Transcript_92495/m.188228 type:complete len:359 (+) Transcript_92495:197-1273(+)